MTEHNNFSGPGSQSHFKAVHHYHFGLLVLYHILSLVRPRVEVIKSALMPKYSLLLLYQLDTDSCTYILHTPMFVHFKLDSRKQHSPSRRRHGWPVEYVMNWKTPGGFVYICNLKFWRSCFIFSVPAPYRHQVAYPSHHQGAYLPCDLSCPPHWWGKAGHLGPWGGLYGDRRSNGEEVCCRCLGVALETKKTIIFVHLLNKDRKILYLFTGPYKGFTELSLQITTFNELPYYVA